MISECQELSGRFIPREHPVLLEELSARGDTIVECEECHAPTELGRSCKLVSCFTFPFCKYHLASLCALEVKPSNTINAGLGLFTLTDRKDGEFIAWYSGDSLTLYDLEMRYRRTPESVGDPVPQQYVLSVFQNTNPSQVVVPESSLSRPLSDEEKSVVKLVNGKREIFDPKLFIDAVHTQSHIGRFINRPSTKKQQQETGQAPAETNVKFLNFQYSRGTDQPNFLKVVATKAIKAGSELIASYSQSYTERTESKRVSPLPTVKSWERKDSYWVGLAEQAANRKRNARTELERLQQAEEDLSRLESKKLQLNLLVQGDPNKLPSENPHSLLHQNRKHYLFDPTEAEKSVKREEYRLRKLRELLGSLPEKGTQKLKPSTPVTPALPVVSSPLVVETLPLPKTPVLQPAVPY